jgi:DNA-binding NarL/FixJ family response regulator
MPGLDGLEVLKQMRRQAPRVKTLVLTAFDEEEYLRAVVRAGARGYLLKDASAGELAVAVWDLKAGRTHFGSFATQRLLQDVVDTRGSIARTLTLTPREKEVVSLIAAGLSNKEAAARLGIGVRTVESHRESVMSKLGLRGTAALTRYALAHRLASRRRDGP